MEHLRGWRAMRQDPQWTNKVLIASLLALSAMCIPVFGQLVLAGWVTLMTRRAVSGQDAPLPRMEFDFDYFMKLLQVGFKPFLARLVWSIPMVGIGMATFCCMYAAMGAGVAMTAGGAAAGGEAGGALGGLGMMCMFGFIAIVYPLIMIGIGLPMQIASLRASLTDDVNAAMRFKEVLDMTKLLLKELIIGTLVMSLVSFVAIFASLFTLYLLLPPSMVILGIIHAYFHAELYKVYLEKGGQPLPIGPLEVEGGDPPQVGGQPAQPGW